MRRREQREHIFKLLFMTQFNSRQEMSEQLELYFEGLEDLGEKDREYIREKYSNVLERLEDIDSQLNSTSRGWKTKRMNRVDLTALRLAVYELEYDRDVPVGVAINEAVEIAKRFGGETSGSFVNGILGKIAGAWEKASKTASETEAVPLKPEKEKAEEAADPADTKSVTAEEAEQEHS